MTEFSNMYQKNYGFKSKPITTKNSHSKAIIKQIYQTIGNIIRIFNMSNIVNNETWSGILAATMFSVCATYHTTLQAFPVQLVFSQDAILNIKHVSDCERILHRKQ